MEGGSIWQCILLVLLVALSAFFSSSETAISSANRIRIKNEAGAGNKKAQNALKVTENYDKAISTILIGNNIVNIMAASIGTVLFTTFFGPAGVGISTVVMTIVVLIFGEILPKSSAKENAETLCLKVSGILLILMAFFSPVTKLLVGVRKNISKGSQEENAKPSVTEEELKVIIEEIEDEGVIDSEESELVQSALDFDTIEASEILTPRVDIEGIDIREPVEQVKKCFLEQRYSRLPVYDKTIDSIIGVLHERDFFKAYVTQSEFSIKDILTETIFIPPTKKISDLLKELQGKKIHMAVVIDQYGGTLGLVTLEDILEELVGEIWDESDEVESDATKLGENKYEINGDMDIDDLFELFELEYDEEQIKSNTAGGLALEVLKRIPQQGENFEYNGLKFTIKEVEEQRIIKMTAEKAL